MLLRCLALRLEKSGKKVPLYLRYYLWFYLLLFSLMLAALISTFMDVMKISNWLGAATIEERVKGNMLQEEEHWREKLQSWRDEASLEEYPVLTWFSMTCPLWLVATFTTCAYHTYEHMAAMGKYAQKGHSDPIRAMNLHDKTIRILALPMVYGLMAFEGVVRMWGVVIDQTSNAHHFSSWEERVRYQKDMYEACFMVGDLYESYALHVFGALTIYVLNQKISRQMLTVKDAISPKEQESSPVDTDKDAMYAELDVAFRELMGELKGLTMLGIKLFCLTCFLQAFYKLIVMTLGFYDVFQTWFNTDQEKPLGFFQRPEVKQGAHHFFYGAGFVASFAAIGNVVEVERGFHRNLQEFSPFLKFWGVKVLVSIAFLQTIAMLVFPPFSNWSETRQNIFYASMLCLECFLISLFHLRSWSSSERWYRSLTDVPDGYTAMPEKSDIPPGSPMETESSDSSEVVE